MSRALPNFRFAAVDLIFDELTRSLSESFQTFKLEQSTRVQRIDAYLTSRPF